VRIARSPAEMIQWVGRYLETPEMDAAGRRQVVLDQCQFTDGQSAGRVVACVLDELGAGAAPPPSLPRKKTQGVFTTA
jgi:hypothetical protein